MFTARRGSFCAGRSAVELDGCLGTAAQRLRIFFSWSEGPNVAKMRRGYFLELPNPNFWCCSLRAPQALPRVQTSRRRRGIEPTGLSAVFNYGYLVYHARWALRKLDATAAPRGSKRQPARSSEPPDAIAAAAPHENSPEEGRHLLQHTSHRKAPHTTQR